MAGIGMFKHTQNRPFYKGQIEYTLDLQAIMIEYCWLLFLLIDSTLLPLVLQLCCLQTPTSQSNGHPAQSI